MVKEKMAPTNFRTYEAQARLLAAVIATTNCKLDFKAIAEHAGSDMTPSSVDHRLRPLKQLAKLQKQCVKAGKDPKELPVEKNEIQKLFGDSTPAGLEFHFREVKATGRAQQAAVNEGSDPRNVRVGNPRGSQKSGGQTSAPTTPAASRKRNAITKTAANTTGNRPRKRAAHETFPSDGDEGGGDSADDGLGEPDTPSNRAAKHHHHHHAVAPAQSHGSANNGAGSSFGANGNGGSALNLDAEFPAAKRARADPPSQQQPDAATMRSFSACSSGGGGDNTMPVPSGMFNSYGAARAPSSFTHPAASSASSFHRPQHFTDGAGDYDDGDDDDDDLIEIQAPQFSFSTSQSRRFGGDGGGNSSQLPSSVMSKPDIFDDSESAADIDLTQEGSGMMEEA